MATLDHLASLLLTRLAWTSLQAIVLAGLVGLLLRLLPRLPAATRCALWWLVGLQALLGLAWHAPIALPLLSPPAAVASAVAPPAVIVEPSMQPSTTPGPVTTADAVSPAAIALPATAPASAAATPTGVSRWLHAHWRVLLAALWLFLLLAQVPALLLQHRRTRRLRRDATPLGDAALQAQCVRQARAIGLRRCPPLLASHAVASPQVCGLRRPVVLWPAASPLAPAEASLVLAHELAHLQRGDLVLGWIPALAQRLFFFHPSLRDARIRAAPRSRLRRAGAAAAAHRAAGLRPPAAAAGRGASPAHRTGGRIAHLPQPEEATDHVAADLQRHAARARLAARRARRADRRAAVPRDGHRRAAIEHRHHGGRLPAVRAAGTAGPAIPAAPATAGTARTRHGAAAGTAPAAARAADAARPTRRVRRPPREHQHA
jgi:beta-lactamase regulating signal transducer with metallopeptidase domain